MTIAIDRESGKVLGQVVVDGVGGGLTFAKGQRVLMLLTSAGYLTIAASSVQLETIR